MSKNVASVSPVHAEEKKPKKPQMLTRERAFFEFVSKSGPGTYRQPPTTIGDKIFDYLKDSKGLVCKMHGGKMLVSETNKTA